MRIPLTDKPSIRLEPRMREQKDVPPKSHFADKKTKKTLATNIVASVIYEDYGV